MKTAKFLHDFSKQFSDNLPPSLNHLRHEFEQQLHRGLSQVFEKMNLVTREEFDIQAEVLARMRSKVEQLERIVKEIEVDLESD